jgi:hypothetical protein
MELELFTFCEAASDHGGRLNILGATDTIVAAKLPVKLDRCSIALRFRLSRIEEGEHAVRLTIVDADGNSIMNMNGRMNLQFGDGPATAAANLIINLNAIEFKATGEYSIDAAVDGLLVGSRPLFVRQVQNGKRTGPSVN